MDDYSDVSPSIAVDSLFRDVYRSLEDIQEAPERIDAVSGLIVHCHRSIRNLERIHSNKAQFSITNDDPQDPFGLRKALDQFITSCHALSYIVTPYQEFGREFEGCLFGANWNWKKKQVRSLQQDFGGHQRKLSLILANAVYTTTLEMQRVNDEHEPVLASILRQSERRHTLLERRDRASKPNGTPKQVESQAEEMDWELCLRRYFEYLDSWISQKSSWGSQLLQRHTSTSQQSVYPESVGRLSSNGSTVTSHRDRRGPDVTDTSRFYRRPRARSTIEQNSFTQSQLDLLRSSVGSQSIRSASSTALVIYGSDRKERPTSIPATTDRTCPQNDFPWERLAFKSDFDQLAHLMEQYPELEQAREDIHSQTPSMSSVEARAYIRGRMAGLGAKVTQEVQKILTSSYEGKDNWALVKRNSKREVNSWTPRSVPLPRQFPQTKNQEPSSLNVPKKRHTLAAAPSAVAAGHTPKATPPLVERRALQAEPRAKSDASSSKLRFFSLQDIRPLSTISERPTTSKSRSSSIDRASTRSMIQTFLHKKSNLSNHSLPIREDQESADKGCSSSGSDTIASLKDLELYRLGKSIDQKSVRSFKSGRSGKHRKPKADVWKPLPTEPKQKSMVGPKLMALLKPQRRLQQRLQSRSNGARASLPPSTISLRSQITAKPSGESLARTSLELLKRKDSKVTLFRLGDTMEMPFDIWIRALPYIEGRAATPKGF